MDYINNNVKTFCIIIHFYITEAGVPYNVSIAAINAKGEGNLTSIIIFTRELGMIILLTLLNA